MVSNTVTNETDEYGIITTVVDAWLEDETGSSATLCVRARIYGGNDGINYGVSAKAEYSGNGKSELVEAGSGVINGVDTAVDGTYKWTVDKSHDGWTATCKVTASGAAVDECEALPAEALTTNEVTCEIEITPTTSYTVSYNANGGSNAPSAQTKWHDEPLALSSDKPSKTGYTFKGWAKSKTDTTAEYIAGASYTDNSDVTLYAVWEINTYTISFNANGGTGAPEKQVKTYGQTLKLSSVEPTKDGYLFVGWGTSSDDTTVDYEPGGDYTKNTAATLYAIWIKTYNVTYDANGGTNAPDVQVKTSNITLSLTTDKPTKESHSFLGWSTSSAGGVEYYAGSDYTRDTDITLYAVWESMDSTMKSLNGYYVYDDIARESLRGIVTSGSGSAYTATVKGITRLDAGVSFTMVPHTVSTVISPTLNVNGLGAKQLRQRLSSSPVTTVGGGKESWLVQNNPVRVMYDGMFWVVDVTRPDANNIYGTIPIESGGTGAKTVAAARDNLGLGNTDGALPIANGGTNATTAVEALHNLGITWGTEEVPATGTPNTIYIQIN